jgi:hypothetical protein
MYCNSDPNERDLEQLEELLTYDEDLLVDNQQALIDEVVAFLIN